MHKFLTILCFGFLLSNCGDQSSKNESKTITSCDELQLVCSRIEPEESEAKVGTEPCGGVDCAPCRDIADCQVDCDMSCGEEEPCNDWDHSDTYPAQVSQRCEIGPTQENTVEIDLPPGSRIDQRGVSVRVWSHPKGVVIGNLDAVLNEGDKTLSVDLSQFKGEKLYVSIGYTEPQDENENVID